MGRQEPWLARDLYEMIEDDMEYLPVNWQPRKPVAPIEHAIDWSTAYTGTYRHHEDGELVTFDVVSFTTDVFDYLGEIPDPKLKNHELGIGIALQVVAASARFEGREVFVGAVFRFGVHQQLMEQTTDSGWVQHDQWVERWSEWRAYSARSHLVKAIGRWGSDRDALITVAANAGLELPDLTELVKENN